MILLENSFIIDVVLQTIYENLLKSEEYMKINRTVLLFEIAENLIKYSILRINNLIKNFYLKM